MEVHDDVDDENDHIETSVSGGQVYAKSPLQDVPRQAWVLIASYGWYIVAALLVMMVVWSKLKPYYYAWKKKQEKIQDEINFDPVKAEEMQDALLRSRERMQHLHDEKEAEYQRKQAERAAADRDEKIKQWESFKVVTKFKRSKHQGSASSNYSPMGGGGGSGGYRPPRRTVGGGGGG
ncbi:hypothetical protein EMCRGX_G011068 [Ephydatia muelleri]